MRAIGNITTSATTEVAIDSTAYAEQAANGGRSFKSSSASDAAAGTGARTIKLTYVSIAADGTIARKTETVTLNGTNAVATVATDIAGVERIDVMTVGSGGVPAGTITMYANNDGTGATIATVAIGKLSTFYAHHYVATGQRCRLGSLVVLGGNATAAQFQIRSQPYPKANVGEVPINGPLAASNANSILEPLDGAKFVSGPAKITVYATPGNNTSQVSSAELAFDDI